MPRLFTAIEIPDDVRARLARLKSPLPGAKWVDPELLHISLRVAGDIDNLSAREFADALSQIGGSAFEITIADLGAFGGNDPRVLWAGVEGGPELETLHRANERAARIAGLPVDGRGFKPHVTLARLRHARADTIARFLGRHGAIRFEPFLVDRFVLMSSRPNIGGGPYVIEETFSLAWAADEMDWPEAGESSLG